VFPCSVLTGPSTLSPTLNACVATLEGLGTSWGQSEGGLPAADVPYNRTALVDVLLHTVKHYNDGWGGGTNFSATSHTRFWEVWNEPDSSCDYAVGESGCGRFWNRTASEFYDLIDETVRAIKVYDPSLQVGSDGVAGVRCAFSDRNLHSRMPLDPTPARLKRADV
jgi:hypothetical protein